MPGFIPDVDAMHSCIPTFIVLITFTRRLIRLPRPGTWLAEGPQRQLRFPSFSASDSGLEANPGGGPGGSGGDSGGEDD